MMKHNTYRRKKSNGQTMAGSAGSTKNRMPCTMSCTVVVFLLLIPVLFSCKSREPMTKRLYMQQEQVDLLMPDGLMDSTGRAVLREEVTYRHADNTSTETGEADSISKGKRSISETQHLKEVTVVGTLKQKFAPERDGKVNVDFVIGVPRALLYSDWRVSLYPVLLHNDSVVALDPIALKGENFFARQQSDSLDYEAFLNSIVAVSDYDSVFANRKAIAKDLRKLQKYYWRQYDKQYREVMAYANWERKVQERHNLFNEKKEGNRLNLYHKYMREQWEKRMRHSSARKDTTGLGSKYANRFEKRTKLLPQYHLNRTLEAYKVPEEYKQFFLDSIRPQDITSRGTSEKDSLEIASHRYFFDRIASNEMRDKQRDVVRDRMIVFGDVSGLRLDSVVTDKQDFLFYYKQEYPVSPRLNRLRIALNGKVLATDLSTYALPETDTLHYLISSLSQLADTSLIVKKTKLFRYMHYKLAVFPQFRTNRTDFRVGYQNNKQSADTIINRYEKLIDGMGLQMDSLQIFSWTSPEGPFENNFEISLQRAESFSAYLQSAYPDIMNVNTIKVVPKGEDWQGLVDEMKKRDDIANRDSIFAIVQRAVFPDKMLEEIRQRFGKDYSIISREIYPKLQRMDVVFRLSRPGMTVSDSMQYQVREGYEEGLKLLQEREYWKALQILKNYPDYNTALCLACMGYNGMAYDLLVKLPESAANEYLLAIVTQRMSDEEKAVSHLLNAITLDPNKAYRIERDSEVIALVEKHQLHQKIDEIQNEAKQQTEPVVDEQQDDDEQQQTEEEEQTDEQKKNGEQEEDKEPAVSIDEEQ